MTTQRSTPGKRRPITRKDGRLVNGLYPYNNARRARADFMRYAQQAADPEQQQLCEELAHNVERTWQWGATAQAQQEDSGNG